MMKLVLPSCPALIGLCGHFSFLYWRGAHEAKRNQLWQIVFAKSGIKGRYPKRLQREK
jgi:hypothetical protein